MGCDDTGAPPPGWVRPTVLFDAKNASPGQAGAVFEAAEELGEATVRRINGFGESKTSRAFRSTCHCFRTVVKAGNGAIERPQDWY